MLSIANRNGTHGLIRGKNKYEVPFIYDVNVPSELIAMISDENNEIIFDNVSYINYLIRMFNHYGEIYDLDANILAAQAYAESAFKVWNYAPYPSTATGLTQFLIGTMFEVIIENKYIVDPKFTQDEINKIIQNVEQPYSIESYRVGGNRNLNQNDSNFENRSRSRKNRFYLLLNAMNNPDLMIKAQCRYMKYIANRNNNLASNTLFAYNRGSSFRSHNYTGIINEARKRRGDDYIQEGIKYVEKIFGILGDKYNKITHGKPNDKYFGYKLDLDSDKFDSFNADAG